MKIAFNPSTVAALTTPPNNKDITFDLRGRNIFARGVKFYGTDTNTWRDIKINNVSIGSHTLDLRNGSNTTLTNTNGVVTINSTWRPVVDNLISDSTTSSLSAKQGKVLKALIDGKSNSDHNHDGRYVRYYTVTTLDCNNLAAGLTAARVNATNAGTALPSAYLYISDVGTPFQIQIPDSGASYIYKRYYSSGKWSGWFKLNAGYADSAGFASRLEGGSIPEWGTLTAANGFTNVSSYDYGSRGSYGLCGKNNALYMQLDGYFYQSEGRYRVLDTSDVADLKGNLAVNQYLSSTDNAWYPLIWGGSSHSNTSNSTGAVYKSHDKLSWQTSSQTLYATRLLSESLTTGSIRNLAIGGGIYWNPNVESASDGSDAASITVVKSGVAGGTTLVLSQMNDTNDTIQFQTNTAARLYHNSYQILTTQNTYVSNNKGYINGTEITQVNNSDKVDNRHAISTTPNTGIIYKAAIYTSSSLTSYWVRLASISSIVQNEEFVATIHVQSGHSNPGRSAILLVYLRGNASSFMSKSFKICCNSNYDPNRFRLYYKDSDKTSEIWYHTTGQGDGIITTVISQSSEGSLYERLTLYSGSITAVQTPSVSTYLSAQVSTITDNISGNASTATKLQTPRTIWGQSFDGTGNVSGSLSEVGNIHFKVDNSYDIGSNAAASRYIYTHWLGAGSGRKLELGANNSEFGQGLCIDTNLNVGIGTNSPAYKLHVAGDIYTTTGFKKNGSSDSYVLLGGGGHKAISDFAISTHTHGLLHSDLTVTLANTTTDSGWSMINSSYNGFLLKSIRTQGSAPNWIENNYAAGICFGGADTKGVVSVACDRPYIKFAGGNGSKPVWWIRLSGISGATYNLANFNADMVDGYHENSFLRYREATYTDQEATLWSQIGIKQYNNALPDNLTGVYNYGSVISLPGFNSRFEIYASHQSSNSNGLYYRSGWGSDKKTWLKFIDSSNIGRQSVNYANSAGHANSAGNADTLGGMPKNYGQAPYGTIPCIGNDGVMEIGRYIDFHSDNSGSYDYSTRIQATGNYKNTVNLPSASGTLALTSYGGDDSTPIFLGYLNLDHGNDGIVSSSFYCLGYLVSFTYTRGGNYCRISIPDTTRLSFYINAAIASVNYSGGGMDTWTGEHRGDGAWWLHCYVSGWNEVRVKGFRNSSGDNDGWWGGNPLYSGSGSANRITVCIFGHVRYK